jgi:uncharacterized protein (TIGR02147 family)
VVDRLGLSRAQAKKAVDTLIRLEVIKVSEDGTWVRSQNGHRTSDGIKNISIRKSHLETLDLARESIMNDVYEETDYTSLTFPLDVEDLPRAKEKIRKFQNELFEEFNTSKTPKDVYRIGVQLFPLTRTPNKGKQL